MKGKSLLSFGLSLAILAGGCLPVLAESQQEATKQSRQTIQRLPNGNYFYGKSRLPNQEDVDYFAFRKTGNTVIGVKFRCIFLKLKRLRVPQNIMEIELIYRAPLETKSFFILS